jgi:hypothetical protein
MHVIPETIHGQYITYLNLHAHNFTKRTSLSPKSSLTPPLIIEMLVTSQGSKRSHICVLGIHLAVDEWFLLCLVKLLSLSPFHSRHY